MIAIILLSILLIISLYIIYNLMRKVEELEDTLVEQYDANNVLYNTMDGLLNKMREIDDSGIFESDDQVGVVFNELKDAISIANGVEGDILDE